MNSRNKNKNNQNEFYSKAAASTDVNINNNFINNNTLTYADVNVINAVADADSAFAIITNSSNFISEKKIDYKIGNENIYDANFCKLKSK